MFFSLRTILSDAYHSSSAWHIKLASAEHICRLNMVKLTNTTVKLTNTLINRHVANGIKMPCGDIIWKHQDLNI
jgi:hypothetical protein